MEEKCTSVIIRAVTISFQCTSSQALCDFVFTVYYFLFSPMCTDVLYAPTQKSLSSPTSHKLTAALLYISQNDHACVIHLIVD